MIATLEAVPGGMLAKTAGKAAARGLRAARRFAGDQIEKALHWVLKRGARSGKVSDAAAKDISRITKSLDETGSLPADYTRRGRQPGTTAGGRPWQNRDGQIQGGQGRLREADVGDIKVGPDGQRGAERVLYDEAGNVWYTPDHYETFVPVRTGRSL